MSIKNRNFMSFRACRGISYIFLLLLTSCELPFDLKTLGDRDMLKLYCEVVSGDTTVLDMDVLVPVGYHERTPVKVGPEDVVMTVDGKEVEIRVAADDDPNLEPGTLYVRENFPAGSQMCIKASIEGADPIEAKTVMPLHLDDYRLEMQLTDIVSGSYNGDNVRDMVRARLILPEVAEGTHVGIQYVVRHKTDSCGVMLFDEQVLQAVYDVTEFSSDGNLVSGVDFSNLTRLGATLTYVWNATDEYEFLFRHLTDSVSEWKDENGETVTWSSDYHFKFRIFALSEEYYQYHSRTTNEFFELGMASPSYTYTNVHGGTGMFGAISVAETPWMDDDLFGSDGTAGKEEK